METIIQRIEFPELIFGFVAPIGADQDAVINAFATYFKTQGYHVVDIKVTDIYDRLKPFIKPDVELSLTPPQKRYKSYIQYGDQLRAAFNDDSFLATTAIARIVEARAALPVAERFSKTVYLVHQFKRREEIALLRAVYGDVFFQISIYSRRGARVDTLARTFAEGADSANINLYRQQA